MRLLLPLVRFNAGTYLHRDKFLCRLGHLSAHLTGLDDANDHVAPSLNSFEGRRRRGVMIVLDRFDLLEDVRTDPAYLQQNVLPLQEA